MKRPQLHFIYFIQMSPLSAISRWAVSVTVDASSGCHNLLPIARRAFKAWLQIRLFLISLLIIACIPNPLEVQMIQIKMQLGILCKSFLYDVVRVCTNAWTFSKQTWRTNKHVLPLFLIRLWRFNHVILWIVYPVSLFSSRTKIKPDILI